MSMTIHGGTPVVPLPFAPGVVRPGRTLVEHLDDHDNPHGVTAEQVGLGAVDNTKDVDKPVSAPQQKAITSAKEYAEELVRAESSRASGKEQELRDKIDVEERRAESAESALDQAINAEKSRAEDAESELRELIKQDVMPELDAEPIKDSQNSVRSGGVWSAVWGALAALPPGFTSLYDWCAAKLDGKLDKSGGTLTGEFRVKGTNGDANFQVVPENSTEINYTPPTMKFGDGAGVVGIIWRIENGYVEMDVSDVNVAHNRIALPSASGTLALTSDIPNVRYPLGAPITASARLADRTMNRVNALSTLTDAIDLTFPAAVQGMGRDFLVRVHRETGGVAINFTVPTGATVFGDGFSSAIGEGEDWLYAITETAANEWYVRAIKLEVAE